MKKKIIAIFVMTAMICSIPGLQGIAIFEKSTCKINLYDVEWAKTYGSSEFDMVIIAPNSFSDALQPLIDHKNNVGIVTFLKTTEDIYDEYEGRDQAEQIKYFIYESAENLNIKYILLVGDVDTTPIRKTEVNHIWTSVNLTQVDDIITDLYYADIYDSDGNFSNWDSNNDDIFSEYYMYNLGRQPGEIGVVDKVDLYPDIGVGRIPCTNVDELEIVVNKIIRYETQTNMDWFYKIILAAIESRGEVITEGIADIMKDFIPIKLYASMNKYGPNFINKEINNGAGFFVSATHGRFMAFNLYYKPFIKGLDNYDKLPIVFFGGCQNAQLDATFHELFEEFGLLRFDKFLQSIHIDTEKLQSCIAWNFLKYESGGSIASIGMTRKGQALDDDPSGGFIGLVGDKFFKSYEPGIKLSDLFNKAITSFIDETWKDYVTLQMFIILGDPSLKIGGYQN